jgi:phosphate transport system substrate-binding protein
MHDFFDGIIFYTDFTKPSLLFYLIDLSFIVSKQDWQKENYYEEKVESFIMKRKLMALFLMGALSIATLSGCGSSSSSSSESSSETSAAETTKAETSASSEAKTVTGPITVVTREEGSGTRGAFIELLKIEEKDANGSKIDHTSKEAVQANKTDVMLTQVASDEAAIGYVSLGSLNDTVKAVKVDGVEATVENIKNGSYKVSRPFNIAIKGEATGLKADFIKFILSKEGQKVVADNKYIPVNDAAESFTSDNSEGKLVVAGSSSVTPVMEKLAEAYKAINSKATIEVQQSDSTSGIKAAIDGTADIAMASRELKDTEAKELNPTPIAMDGIAVIVNKANPIDNLSSAAIKSIYIGETTNWEDVK